MTMSLLVISLYSIFSATFLSAANVEERESKIVHTAQGSVKGYRNDYDDVYSFYGIPYASTPTGADRYKAPLPGPSWLTPLDAVTENIVCPQYIPPEYRSNPSSLNVMMKEDCLVANVFVPNTTQNNLPVLVIVHGGRYLFGAGNLFKPKNLVRAHNIIVVTFNYRLGVHGFLCLGTEAAPGNAGMKDQVALLRWIKTNIANFGGNPDDVTISGYSAGGVSVMLLMLSPLAKGLFKKVIAESGDSLAEYAVQNDPIENAKRYARIFTVDNVDDVNALESFYTTASFETITSFAYGIKDLSYYITPCLEIDVGQEIFQADSPYDTLKTGQFNKVPIMTGFTSGEGLLVIESFESYKNEMNANFSNFLPGYLQFESIDEKERVAKKVKKFYFGNKNISDETILSYVDYFSDIIITFSLLKEVQLLVDAGQNNVFLFEYSYVDELTPVIPHTNVKRPGHAFESYAIFDGIPNSANITEDYLPADTKKHKATLRQIWSNFIKTGVPVPKCSSLPAWPPVGALASPHMDLGRQLQLRGPLLPERKRFWDNIYKKYRRSPQRPYPFPNSSEKDIVFYISK